MGGNYQMNKMKFFDIDWIKGNISDNEYAIRERRYDAYLAKISKNLHAVERIFASINFNDAVLALKRQMNDKLSLEFYIGDLQNGYYGLKSDMIVNEINHFNLGEIIVSEFSCKSDGYCFSYILSDLKENIISFCSIKNLKFHKISERKYILELKKFRSKD